MTSKSKLMIFTVMLFTIAGIADIIFKGKMYKMFFGRS